MRERQEPSGGPKPREVVLGLQGAAYMQMEEEVKKRKAVIKAMESTAKVGKSEARFKPGASVRACWEILAWVVYSTCMVHNCEPRGTAGDSTAGSATTSGTTVKHEPEAPNLYHWDNWL